MHVVLTLKAATASSCARRQRAGKPHPFVVMVMHALHNIVRPPAGGVTYEAVEDELYNRKQEEQRRKLKDKECASELPAEETCSSNRF